LFSFSFGSPVQSFLQNHAIAKTIAVMMGVMIPNMVSISLLLMVIKVPLFLSISLPHPSH
jgi:hypothetical protein